MMYLWMFLPAGLLDYQVFLPDGALDYAIFVPESDGGLIIEL